MARLTLDLGATAGGILTGCLALTLAVALILLRDWRPRP